MWELYWIVVNSYPFLFFCGFSVPFAYIPCNLNSSRVSSTSQLFLSIKLSSKLNCSATFLTNCVALQMLLFGNDKTFHYILGPSCCCQHYNNSIFIGFLLPLRIAYGILKENGLFEGFRTVLKSI